MLEIPLIAYPNRSLQVILDGQECGIALYQRGERLYMDMDVGATRVITGAVCLDAVSIIQRAQSVFAGSLIFVDTQGNEAPEWHGLGTRWRLLYISAGEVVA